MVTAASHNLSRSRGAEEVMLIAAAVTQVSKESYALTHIMSHFQTLVIFRFLLGMAFFLFSM